MSVELCIKQAIAGLLTYSAISDPNELGWKICDKGYNPNVLGND